MKYIILHAVHSFPHRQHDGVYVWTAFKHENARFDVGFPALAFGVFV